MTKALTRLRGCTGCYKLLAFTQQKHYVLTTFHNISKKHSHSAKWKRLDGEIQHVFFSRMTETLTCFVMHMYMYNN